MPIIKNLSEISDVYLGSEKITDVYAGDKEIYSEGPSGPLYACYYAQGCYVYVKTPLGSDYMGYWVPPYGFTSATDSSRLSSSGVKLSNITEQKVTSAKTGLVMNRNTSLDLYT